MSFLRWCAALALVMVGPRAPLAAQEWGAADTRELVGRAIARREAADAEPALRRWEARARGLVLFLTQLGEEARPRLVKADELVVEVYWEAPGPGKQQIVAWRDRAWLPTDIHYHRDHLGIVTSDFGPLIRIGEGDEVRDVPHPLSAAGAPGYEFAPGGRLTLESAGRAITVEAVRVRPRDPSRPGVLGVLYLDTGTAALVRFHFTFTPASYLEAGLESIVVELENSLHEGRHWLPWKQSIEIRRGSGVVDFPIEGIIRGTWELEDIRLAGEVAPRVMAGAAIGGLLAPGGPDTAWQMPLEQRVAGATDDLRPAEVRALRAELQALAGQRMARVGPPVRLAFGRISDIVRINRVEGVRLGLGASFRVPGITEATLAPWLAYGTADHRLSGRLVLAVRASPRLVLRAAGLRQVEDLGGEPPVSQPVNSLLAQEAGVDRGDWVERRAAEVGAEWRPPGGFTLEGSLVRQAWRSLDVAASPARGAFRPNPALGMGGAFWVGALALSRTTGGDEARRGSWRLGVEAGTGRAGHYLRLDAAAMLRLPAGPGELGLELSGTRGLGGLPAARQVAIGGWGTLPGEQYRQYGGRWSALARVEYLLALPVPELPLGSFAGTGSAWQVGPFVAAGAAGGSLPGVVQSWQTSGGIRPVAGIAIEALWRVVRAEIGFSLRGNRAGGSVDLARPWWAVL